MNILLDTCWRSGVQPFDGNVLIVPPTQLADGRFAVALRATAKALERLFAATELRSLHDWHEHDGYLTDAEPSSWHALKTLLTSDEAIAASCSDDSYVLRLVYPTSLEFCLRFRPRFDDVEPALHVFASKATLHTIRTSLEAAGFNDLQLEPATPFLLRSYPE